MKKTSRKVIISSLIALTGVTLASSITGTVAWFQYATQVTAAYTGTTAHCSKLLQIAMAPAADADPVWKSDLPSGELPDVTFEPITSGDQAKDADLAHLYAAPDYRQGLYSNWLTATAGSYSQFEIWLKTTDIDENYGTENQNYLANDVYLTDLTIQDVNNLDLAKAVRVHFDALSPDNTHKYFLFANTATQTNVGGQLDLNNDGELDTLGYEFESTPCIYGGNNLVQTSYASNDSSVKASESRGVISGGTSFGKTGAAANQYLKIKVTIWLEGWELLNTGANGSSNNNVWSTATYTSKSFNVGMTFGVQLHSSADHPTSSSNPGSSQD